MERLVWKRAGSMKSFSPGDMVILERTAENDHVPPHAYVREFVGLGRSIAPSPVPGHVVGRMSASDTAIIIAVVKLDGEYRALVLTSCGTLGWQFVDVFTKVVQ
jgi:hypothetical protein